MIFRLSENVPDVYVKESRDFQLLCNSFDAVQNSVKYDIDSILNNLVVPNCVDSYVPFLQTKLGFFTDTSYNNDILRILLQVFPLIVRYKGSIYGIQLAVYAYLHALGLDISSKIQVDNVAFVITISFRTETLDVRILTDLLKYVLPAGYKLKYGFYEATIPFNVAGVADRIYISCNQGTTSTHIVLRPDSEQEDESRSYEQYNLDSVSTSRLQIQEQEKDKNE